MSQNDTLHLAQEFLRRMGSGVEPSEIAKLFSETLEWDIAGDTGALPWIGHKSGRAAITDFVRDSRAMRHSGQRQPSSDTWFAHVETQAKRQRRHDGLRHRAHRRQW